MPTITGTVELDETAIEEASVIAVEHNTDDTILSDTTNADGNYSFDVSEEETYHIAVSYDDGTEKYNDETAPFTPSELDETIDFSLSSYTVPSNDNVNYSLEVFSPPARVATRSIDAFVVGLNSDIRVITSGQAQTINDTFIRRNIIRSGIIR